VLGLTPRSPAGPSRRDETERTERTQKAVRSEPPDPAVRRCLAARDRRRGSGPRDPPHVSGTCTG